jgi:internalin A
VSYAWGDDTPEGVARDGVVNQLCDAAAARGIRIARDREVLGLGERISTFMQQIGTGDRIFVILSDKYLRSPYCMYELSEIWRTSKQEGEAFRQRVRVYVVDKVAVWGPEDWAGWAVHWKTEYDKLDAIGRQHGAAMLGEQGHRRLMQMQGFYTQVADILATLADIVQPRSFEELQRYGFDEPAGQVPPLSPAGSSPPSVDDYHQRLAVKLLTAVQATPFFLALRDELADGLAPGTDLRTPEAIAGCFARCDGAEQQVLELFSSVRRALDSAPPAADDARLRQRCEEAAAALYCIAACCLVGLASQAARTSYVVRVPRPEPILCAVIATALFGGEIRMMPPERGELPTVPYVFEVTTAGVGDQPVNDFERAAYIASFPNDHETPDISTFDGPLDSHHRAKLAARLRTVKRVRRASLSFVVRSDFSADAYEHFGSTHQVPVLVPDSETTSVLLGMQVETLLAEIAEFWAELKAMRGAASPAHPQPPPHSTSGDASMPGSGPIFNIGTVAGPLAVSTGSHSAAQAGEGQTAHIDQRQGAALTELVPLLQELAQEIARLDSGGKRNKLAAHIEDAQREAGQNTATSPGGIKGALDAIKSSAEGLEQSGKIISLCNKAYNVIAPLLSLPPSPLS